jgi:hypothetical protein
MHEATPVKIINVSLRARAHKARGYNHTPVEASLVIELLAMDQPAGSLSICAATGFLYDEPFRKPPDANSLGGLTGVVLLWRGRKEPWRRDPRHDLQLACEPYLRNFLQITRLRPVFEATNDRRMSR